MMYRVLNKDISVICNGFEIFIYVSCSLITLATVSAGLITLPLHYFLLMKSSDKLYNSFIQQPKCPVISKINDYLHWWSKQFVLGYFKFFKQKLCTLLLWLSQWASRSVLSIVLTAEQRDIVSKRSQLATWRRRRQEKKKLQKQEERKLKSGSGYRKSWKNRMPFLLVPTIICWTSAVTRSETFLLFWKIRHCFQAPPNSC